MRRPITLSLSSSFLKKVYNVWFIIDLISRTFVRLGYIPPASALSQTFSPLKRTSKRPPSLGVRLMAASPPYAWKNSLTIQAAVPWWPQGTQYKMSIVNLPIILISPQWIYDFLAIAWLLKEKRCVRIHYLEIAPSIRKTLVLFNPS